MIIPSIVLGPTAIEQHVILRHARERRRGVDGDLGAGEADFRTVRRNRLDGGIIRCLLNVDILAGDSVELLADGQHDIRIRVDSRGIIRGRNGRSTGRGGIDCDRESI